MKDLVDKSMGIVTRIAEGLTKIKPTDPLRLSKHTEWRKHRKLITGDFLKVVRFLG
jgi:hypothetical protein